MKKCKVISVFLIMVLLLGGCSKYDNKEGGTDQDKSNNDLYTDNQVDSGKDEEKNIEEGVKSIVDEDESTGNEERNIADEEKDIEDASIKFSVTNNDNSISPSLEPEENSNSKSLSQETSNLSGTSGAFDFVIQGSTDKDNYIYPDSMEITALLHRNGIPIIDANVYASVVSRDNTKMDIELNDWGLMGDEIAGDGLYTGLFSDFKVDGAYQITIYANNNEKKAILGESFVGLPTESGSSVSSSQVPIKESFSKSQLIPSVIVSGTSEKTSIVQLSTDLLKLDEQSETATITVTRTGNINDTMKVDYETIDGTAVAGVDYVAASGNLSYKSGESSKTIQVKLNNSSSSSHQIKDFTINLKNPDKGVLGTPKSARVDIYRTEYSKNADLRRLEVNVGTLDKEFSPDITNYSVSVPYETTKVSVKASVAERWSTMTINGNPVLTGQPSADINLSVGENTIPIVVTAEDEVTQKIYTIIIHREQK